MTFKPSKNKLISLFKTMNSKLDAYDLDLQVESELPLKAVHRKKVKSGEKARDEIIADVLKAYEVNIHNVILDTAVRSITDRFPKNKLFYADLSILDAKNFHQLKNNPEKLQTLVFN